MKKAEKNSSIQSWWNELEEAEQDAVKLNWCCRLILEGGFEEFIQEEIGIFVALRFGVNYCPHCGKPLKKAISGDFSGACCRLFSGLALEGLIFEEPTVDEYGNIEYSVHRLFANYCFNCGKKLRNRLQTTSPDRYMEPYH
ncbi:MAG: hypothetical protein GXO99_04420 [Nitrospirae bacterium]|nr:hypothetical protein [Nitrospirota bacterium]